MCVLAITHAVIVNKKINSNSDLPPTPDPPNGTHTVIITVHVCIFITSYLEHFRRGHPRKQLITITLGATATATATAATAAGAATKAAEADGGVPPVLG